MYYVELFMTSLVIVLLLYVIHKKILGLNQNKSAQVKKFNPKPVVAALEAFYSLAVERLGLDLWVAAGAILGEEELREAKEPWKNIEATKKNHMASITIGAVILYIQNRLPNKLESYQADFESAYGENGENFNPSQFMAEIHRLTDFHDRLDSLTGMKTMLAEIELVRKNLLKATTTEEFEEAQTKAYYLCLDLSRVLNVKFNQEAFSPATA